MTDTNHHQRHVLLAGILLLIAGLVAASDTLRNYAAIAIVWTEGVIAHAPILGLVVFVLLAMTSAMLAFFSSAVLAPIAVNAWGAPASVCVFWLGWFLGGAMSFCIGHYLGRGVAARLIGEDKIAHWESLLNRNTRFIHILLFQAAVPSEIPGYVLGILHYRFDRYLMALALTEVPYAIATVFLGDSFLKGRSALFISLGLAVIALTALLFRKLRRALALQLDSQ
ncbi:MAG: TVP38/TMEM64 family protein [Pseudomonadales bacterium]